MLKFFVMIWVLSFSLLAAESVAFVKSIQGESTLKRDSVTRALQKGEKLFAHDVIQTAAHSTVGISFNDGTRIALGAKTTLAVDEYIFEPSQKSFRFDVTLSKGRAVFESGKIGKLAPEKVSFKVPQGVVGIRGTKFVVEAE